MNSFKIENLVRTNVAKMKPYSSARDEFKADGRKMTFLDANENPFENGVNRYPDPQQATLKSKIAELKGISTSKILLGNGSDEVLDLIFRAFCEPSQDNMISLPPTYGMYKVLAELNQIEDREVLLKVDFQPNVEEILNTVDDNTKLIFLCSPNNPTGNVFSMTLVEKLLNGFNGLVVIDEAYIDFSNEPGWLQALEDFPNLVVTQTLSKAYGLAGIRLGIGYASEEIIEILNKIKPPYNVNELTQQKAAERLRNPEEVEFEIKQILEQREYLEKELQKVDFVKKIYPSKTNFLLVRVDNADLRYSQLLEKGIVVRNRSNQPLCENTIRFTVGTKTENNRLINALNEIAG
ncbi:histidinol-phosphate aminotransferase [Salinimicrobium catena]|uniref:Histidinol-phosphate aminotransferase n=1 Tax=Salinimicrobium catena TaxID=390640 RepID=A0A1H5M6T9_9FLAO|nr:histidinol-phosphate transaminase [Salinimicrobium catena]SDL19201.1 histidinol-phosphate aminotransferase [Salinimicrobium catena]SEE84920.1 histidinol-phosphate aminotransferase [Salinimicrobium catena]